MIETESLVAPPSPGGLFVPEDGDSDVPLPDIDDHFPSPTLLPSSHISGADDEDDLMGLDDILTDQQRDVEVRTESIPNDPTPNRSSNPPSDNDPTEHHSGEDQPSTRKKVRPMRQASKKALEEMDRETQRLTRAMNLQHEAKPRKTFSLTGFLSKFAEKPEEIALVTSETTLPLDQTSASHTPKLASPEKQLPRTIDLSDDSNSDLEIVHSEPQQTRQQSRFDLLDKALSTSRGTDKESQEQRQLTLLRALAHVNVPVTRPTGKKADVDADSAMTSSQLFATLRRKARAQAAQEREARIQKLVADGTYVSNETEEKHQLEVENFLDKARSEAQRIAKSEKQSGDGDDEAESDYEEASDEDSPDDGREFVDPDAWDSEMEEDLVDSDGEEDENVQDSTKIHAASRRRAVMDEDDEIEATVLEPANLDDTPMLEVLDSQPSQGTKLTSTANDDPYAALRQMAPEPSMSLSQAFAGTIGDFFQSGETADDEMLTDYGAPVPGAMAHPQSTNSTFTPPSLMEDSLSQIQVSGTQTLPPGFSQLGTPGMDWTTIDPSQDKGFDVSRSPRGHLVATQVDIPSTQIPGTQTQLPIQIAAPREQKKRKRDKEEKPSKVKRVKEKLKASKEIQGLFDEEAALSDSDLAEFSDENDEDNSADEDSAFQKQLIDDDATFTAADEDALHTIIAAQSKNADQKLLKRLVRDLDTGGLRDLHNRRRRQGGQNVDGGHHFLSDDSDDEATERRRWKKQQEFSRMRRALLAGDERIAGMADNPKQEAFLRAIEDRDTEPDASWLDGGDDDSNSVSTSAYPDSDRDHSAPLSRINSAESSRLGSPDILTRLEPQSREQSPAESETSTSSTSWSRSSSGAKTKSKLGRTASRLRFPAQDDSESLGLIDDLVGVQEDEMFVHLSASDEEANDDSSYSTLAHMSVIDRAITKPTASSSSSLLSTPVTHKNGRSTTTGSTAKRGKGPILLRRLVHKNLNSRTGSGSTASTSFSEADIQVERRTGISTSGPPSRNQASRENGNPNGSGTASASVSSSQAHHHPRKDDGGIRTLGGTAASGRKLLGKMLKQDDGFD